MSYPNPNQAYTEAAVRSASPAQRVVMLYDGALRFLSQAQMAMEQGDLGEARTRLLRAENIIDHLNTSLDMNHEVSDNLSAIYLFCRRHLLEALVERNSDKIGEVAGLLGGLRESWLEISQQPQPATASG